MESESHGSGERSRGTKLTPIPTPVTARWREFRIKYMPILVFGVTIVAIWQLWKQMPPATGFRGIGEGPISLLTSPQDGFIDTVAVQPHGHVEAGAPILTIVPFDPGARLDFLQSQLQISRLALEPSVADRNALNYERLRVDSLQLKQDLAMAKVNLDRAAKMLPRHAELLKDRLISQDLYDLTVRDRDFYTAEIEEKTKALEEIQGHLLRLKPMAESAHPGTNPEAELLIPKLQAEMAAVQTNWNPVILRAPITGEIQFYRGAGEFVRAGEPLLVINSAKADRIIAYLKQPAPFNPEVGMAMEVITREMKPRRFETAISQVGARVEIITNAIAFIAVGALVDSGLPLILPVPENVQIRPGEVVDVTWKRSGAKTTQTLGVGGAN